MGLSRLLMSVLLVFATPTLLQRSRPPAHLPRGRFGGVSSTNEIVPRVTASTSRDRAMRLRWPAVPSCSSGVRRW